MQALLSFEQAPPLSAPLRFFLTAPPFALLAGLLILYGGPDVFASRWTPEALALTHLITAGFMLQVMLGAMFQMLPVVAGANLARPLLLATLVHLAITPGALLLALAFLTNLPVCFDLALILLTGGLALFLGATAWALWRVPPTSPTIRGLKLALLGLGVTAALGVALVATLRGWLVAPLPLAQLTTLHFGWGLAGWGFVLLAAVALTVVPMFQMTPPYPRWFADGFAPSLVVVLLLWTGAEWFAWFWPAIGLGVFAVAGIATFAILTLSLQRRSKRARSDATQRLWRIGMLCALAASVLCLLPEADPVVAQRVQWLCGVLVLCGAFQSVMVGMLYKIVPFLVWLHLQNAAGGRILPPTMNQVISATQIDRQAQAHLLALALLAAAVLWPDWFSHLAGLAVVVASIWLQHNLLCALAVYRRQQARIASLPAAPGDR